MINNITHDSQELFYALWGGLFLGITLKYNEFRHAESTRNFLCLMDPQDGA